MTDRSAADAPRFEILGSVRAFRSGRSVDLGPAKQRAVLAVLVLNLGKPVQTHRIVDAVWGDEPPENGPNVVQKYVAGLRRVLDPDRSPRTPGELLALTDGGYVLRVGSLDAEDFRNGLARADAERRAGNLDEAGRIARAAIDLWHGEALGGLTGPVFEAARTRLAEEQASAWELWAEIELSRGGFAGLVSELSHLVQEFPLREGLRAQLMIALHRSGRQAEALAAFRDAREFFLDELGAEPGERLQETHRRILRNEPLPDSLPLPPPPDVPPIPVQPYSPPVPVQPYSPPATAQPYPPGTAQPSPQPGTAQPYSPAPPPPGALPAPYSSPPAGAIPWQYSPVRPESAHLAAPQMWASGPLPGNLVGPRREASPWAEVIIAALLPIATCSLGSWVYFAYAAIQRRTRRETLTVGGYLTAFATMVFLLAVDPSDLESEVLSGAEEAGLLFGLLLIATSSVHGAILASRPGDTRQDRARRELARQFATVNPAGARQAGIGRPDLLRTFDDGGLVDLNHAPIQEIARLPGINPAEAHRVIVDRYENGPYQTPDDLVRRSVLPEKKLRRLARWLICVAPEPATPPTARQ